MHCPQKWVVVPSLFQRKWWDAIGFAGIAGIAHSWTEVSKWENGIFLKGCEIVKLGTPVVTKYLGWSHKWIGRYISQQPTILMWEPGYQVWYGLGTPKKPDSSRLQVKPHCGLSGVSKKISTCNLQHGIQPIPSRNSHRTPVMTFISEDSWCSSPLSTWWFYTWKSELYIFIMLWNCPQCLRDSK